MNGMIYPYLLFPFFFFRDFPFYARDTSSSSSSCPPLFSIVKKKKEREAMRREDPVGYSLGEICLNCSSKLRPSWPPSPSPNSILYDCRLLRGPHTR